MESWKVGEVEITRVVDVILNMDPTFLLPEATPENLAPMAAWIKPWFVNEDDTIPLSIHTFLVKTPDTLIVVDTCIGNDKPRALEAWNLRQDDFLARLERVGGSRKNVDVVLCTHLHVDHVGWNTMLMDGVWQPTFPNARYLIAADEWAYWQDEEDPFGKEAKKDSILPIIESDLVDLVEVNHRVCESVTLVPTPGHTPGHVSVMVESEGCRAIITGDLFHHPAQIACPHWRDTADVDAQLAESTRRAFLQQYGEDVLVLGTHFNSPTAGHIVPDGDAHRFRVFLP